METVIRKASVKRETNETDISMDFAIDGSGKAEISTGIGFFDHMLNSFTRHGLFDMKLSVKGDWAYANGEAMLMEDEPEMQDYENQ